MATYQVVTRISAVDGVTGVVGRIRGSLAALTGNLGMVGRLAPTAAVAGIGRLGAGIDAASQRASGLLTRVTTLVPALGALGAVSSVAGLWSLTKGWAAMADTLATTATKAGVTVEELQELRYAAQLSNVEAATLDKSMVKLNKTIYDAATGKNADAAALFKRLGISLVDSNGKMRTAADLLPQIAEGFKRNENPALRTAMATALFGKAGADLIPLLEQGAAAMAKSREEARRFGLITKEQAAAAGELDDAFDHLAAAGAGLGNRIAAAVAPKLLPLVQGLTDWVVANREMIGQAVERKLERIGQAFAAVGRAFDYVMASPVGDFLRGLADSGGAFDAAMIAVGGTLAGPLLGAISAVSKALLLNPFGIAASAAIAAVYLIYTHWDSIVSYFTGKIDRVREAFDVGFVQGLGALLSEFNPFEIVWDALTALSERLFGFDLASAGRRLVQSLIDGIRSLLPSLDVVTEPLARIGRFLGFGGDNGQRAMAQGTGGEFGAPGASPVQKPPSLIAATAGGSAPARIEGGLDVNIKVAGAPGTEISTRTDGSAVSGVRVGRSMADGFNGT